MNLTMILLSVRPIVEYIYGCVERMQVDLKDKRWWYCQYRSMEVRDP
jgi:hypothetical protein